MKKIDALQMAIEAGYTGNESMNYTRDVLFWKHFSLSMGWQDFMEKWKEFIDYSIENHNSEGWFEKL